MGPGRLAALIGAAVVVGLTLGRLVLFEPPAVPAPLAPVDDGLAAAAARLERRVENDPDDRVAWQELGRTYTLRAAETGDATFYGLATRAFGRAEGLARDDPFTTLGRANLALALHQFPRALRLGRSAHVQMPFNAEALGILVDAEVELGHYRRAGRHLQEMLDRKPNLPALARASYLRELHGDLRGAVQAMQQAAAAGSRSAFDVAVVHALLGDLHLKRGDLAGAADAYERSVHLAPGNVQATVGLARLEAVQGSPPRAIASLRQLTRTRPHIDALTVLANLLEVEQRDQEAEQVATLIRSIAALQQDAGQVVDLELALFEADAGERSRQAVTLARRAHRARPDSIYAADALAWALHRAGRSGAAVRYAEQAVRLDTADPLLHYHAAAVLHAVDRQERARARLRRLGTFAPHFSFQHRSDAARLADRLNVALPASWGRP